MRILVVEDEVKTADYISKGLRENNFVVDIMHNGVDGLFSASQYPYDLVILDIMLPKKDGFTVDRKSVV